MEDGEGQVHRLQVEDRCSLEDLVTVLDLVKVEDRLKLVHRVRHKLNLGCSLELV